MYKTNLGYSQILKEHPLKSEKDSFKIKYINLLEYMIQKYSNDNDWSAETLKLYKEELLSDQENYHYNEENISSILKSVLSTRFKFFKFYTYRYCIIYDIIFMNAPHNIIKARRIITESILPHGFIHKKKMATILESFFDSNINVSSYSVMDYHYKLWLNNYNFKNISQKKILVTANMSAGKSTLINAIVGKKVNKTMNDSCTAKVHYIYNKPYEDGYIYELDNQLNLNASTSILMEDDEGNKDISILVSSYFRTPLSQNKICLIDTPGVNSSQDIEHAEITRNIIKNEKVDLLLYVLNGENIGTNDDINHLHYVYQNNQSSKIVFLINKLDKYHSSEDSIQETLSKVIHDLETIGFESPTVVPISSYTAYLAKSKYYGESLTEDEEDVLEYLSRKLEREDFQFDKYYKNNLSDFNSSTESLLTTIKHSGILQLENILYN